MLYVKALISGKWREYACKNIADVEALQHAFALACIEYKSATYSPDSSLGKIQVMRKKKPIVIPLYESGGGGLAWSGRGPKPRWLKSELERGELLIDFLNPKHPEYAAYKAKLSK